MPEGTGLAVVEATSVEAVNAYVLNWLPFMSVKVTPVLNDADSRKVLSAYFSEQAANK